MAQQYLAFIDSVITGPMPLEELAALIQKKKVTEDTLVLRESDRTWMPASEQVEIQHLFQKSEDQVNQQKKVVQKGVSEPAAAQSPTAGAQDAEKVVAAIDITESGSDVRFKCPHCFQQYAVGMAEFVNARLVCSVCGKPYLIGPDILVTGTDKQTQQATETPSEDPLSTGDLENAFEESDFIPGNIVCPHCWTKFDKKSILYISTHPDLLGDAVAGEFEQKRFSPTVYNADGLPLDERGIPCTDMACPVCHLRMPADSIDCNASFFSIVGAPSSGKSYYLTALIHTLRKVMPEYFDCSFYDADPLINSVVNNYESIIFGSTSPSEVVSLPKTQLSGGDFSTPVTIRRVSVNLPKPFIFRVQPFDEGDASGKWNRSVVFYDNAGEHFQPGNDNFNNPATQHLANSNGIIFLFDPINDPQMRRICQENDPQRKNSSFISAQTSIFAEMVARIRRHGNMTANQTTDIPLIIAVNKFDAWMNSIPLRVKDINPMSPETDGESSLTTVLDVDSVLSVSFAVRDLMLKFAPGIVSQAETLFKHVWFVPVSSFGCLPSEAENGRIGVVPQDINPVWVDVPVAILFHENGLISAKMRKQTPANPSSFMVKTSGDHIVFMHPVTGSRISLPSLYSDAVLEINGVKYHMPKVAANKKSAANAKNTFEWS